MATTPPLPARLHVLLATGSSSAVVLRRGPSKQVATYLWEREDDSFSLGQWLKGRIYERRCDLSADGAHLLYFAMASKTWTAVSRAPFLKALDFYPKDDAWEGGGLFLSPKSYWLNDRNYRKTRHERRETGLRPLLDHEPDGSRGAECLSVYYPRLLRGGWRHVDHEMRGGDHWVDRFERPTRCGWVLQKTAHSGLGSPPGKGCYWDEHATVTPTGASTPYPDWEWADLDQNSIVFAAHGKLFRAACGPEGIAKPVLLRDFNGDTFERVAAPY